MGHSRTQALTYTGTAPRGGTDGNNGDNIYMYSFTASPNAWYPTGNLNFSRIDNATLRLTMKMCAMSAHLGHPYTLGGGGYRVLADEFKFMENCHTGASKSTLVEDLPYGAYENGIN